MRPVNWFFYLFWNNGYYVEFMKLMQLFEINSLDFIIELMKNLIIQKIGLESFIKIF